MGFNQREYLAGRNRGIELAYEIFKDFGIESLRLDIDFRENTKINSTSRTQWVEERSYPVKMQQMEATMVVVLNVLRDEFDFGKSRCQRFVDAWKKETERLGNSPLIDWHEEKERIKKDYGVENLKINAIFKVDKKRRKTDFENGRDDGMKLILKMAEEGRNAEMVDFVAKRPQNTLKNRYFVDGNKETVDMAMNLCHELSVLEIVKVLNKVFGFGQQRMDRFMKRYDLKNNCYGERYVTMQDWVDVIANEIGIKMEYPWLKMEGWVK